MASLRHGHLPAWPLAGMAPCRNGPLAAWPLAGMAPHSMAPCQHDPLLAWPLVSMAYCQNGPLPAKTSPAKDNKPTPWPVFKVIYSPKDWLIAFYMIVTKKFWYKVLMSSTIVFLVVHKWNHRYHGF